MKNTELRIGNLVFDALENAVKCDLIMIGNIDLMKLKPIPLTEEWLLMFGFEVKGDVPDFWEKDDFNGSLFSGSLFGEEFQLVWYELAPCCYVHQLQNLYHSITGKELMPNYLIGYGKEVCGHCGLKRTPEGHDGCIGTLDGVMNACCGHGEERTAYVQFDHPDYEKDPNKKYLKGKQAINYINENKQT